MKKIITLFSLLLVALATLVGCDTKKPTPTPTATPTPTVNPTPTVEPTYTVTFDTVGGSNVSAVTGKAGTQLQAPANPTKSYFTFAGWYTDKTYTTEYTFSTIPASNVTVYAKWIAQEAAVINFESNGGTYVNPIHGTEGDQIVLPTAPEKTGYTFAGWYTDEALTTPFTDTTFGVTEKTVYAKWTATEGMYSVTYHVGNITEEVFTEGSKVVFTNEYTPAGVTVEGWYLDEACTQAATNGATLTASINLYANIYTTGLKFDGNKVTGYTGTVADVYLPSKVAGVTITEIADNAFYDNNKINSVNVPESIVKIGAYAFYNAAYLNEINLSSETTTISEYAFYNCKRLKYITTLGKTTTIGESAFSGCVDLRDFEMTNALVTLGDYAFADCKKLTQLALPETLETIGAYALADCQSLTEVVLPKALTTIGAKAFSGCEGLTSVQLDGQNQSFTLVDGFLMDKAQKVLVKYFDATTDKAYQLPSTVTTIKAYAFEDNTNITTFDLTSVQTLEMGSLYGMKSLTTITVANLDTAIAYYFGAVEAKDNGIANLYVSATLSKVVVKNATKEIPAYTFYGINQLATVEGVDAVESIGEYAFAYTGFTQYTLPTTLKTMSNTSFYRASKLTQFAGNNETYVVKNGCIYTGTKLFAVAPAVANFDFAADCDGVVRGAFAGAKVNELVITNTIKLSLGSLEGILELQSLSIPYVGDGEENQYMQYLFGSTLKIEKKTNESTGEEYDSFSFDTTDGIPASLTTVTLTGNVTKIGNYAFAYFLGLDTINISEKVTSIGKYAFIRNNFKEIDLPATVKEIGEFAFGYNYRLEKVSVAAETLGEGLFAYTFRLEEANFNEGVKAIPEYCFYPYRETDDDDNTLFYSKLEKVYIASSVEEIGKAAFLYAGNYGDNSYYQFNVAVTFAPNSKLKTVGLAAFEYARVFAMELPASVEVIAEQAFYNCSTLETLVVGDATNGSALKTIGAVSFANTKGFKSLTIYKNVVTEEDLPTLELNSSYYPFAGTYSKLAIYVPSASVAIYKNNTQYIAAGLSSKIKAI